MSVPNVDIYFNVWCNENVDIYFNVWCNENIDIYFNVWCNENVDIYTVLKLKIEPHQKPWVNSGVPEG
jgi:acetyltransferase-like isoleucine patch superfamily enzyme